MDMESNLNSPVVADPIPMGSSSSLDPYSGSSPKGLYLPMPRRKILPEKVGDVHASGWLDAMRSSSPTRKRSSRESAHENEVLDMDAAYRKWAIKYPSALTSFEQLTNYAKGKKIALFLDYDGTLSPIVNNPERAFMSGGMRTAVKNVAKYFPTAIISGRSRDKVFEFVKLPELYYAGSHGMDIMCPVKESDSVTNRPNCIRSTDRKGKAVNLFQPASEFLPMINEVFKSLDESTKKIKGAKVENHKFCVSVHYRLVDTESWNLVWEIVDNIIKEYPRLKLTHGRKVLEIRPVIDWNKGKAVEFFLESLGLNNRDDVLSIYIGDDRTDEDAFKVLREGELGFGILVSSVPKESDAFYSLRDPFEVKEFLESLAKWKRSTSLHR